MTAPGKVPSEEVEMAPDQRGEMEKVLVADIQAVPRQFLADGRRARHVDKGRSAYWLQQCLSQSSRRRQSLMHSVTLTYTNCDIAVDIFSESRRSQVRSPISRDGESTHKIFVRLQAAENGRIKEGVN
jgi:hypothetical protein